MNLQKCLLDFNRENTTGFLLKKTLQGFEIYTTQQVLERITEHFTVCPGTDWIQGDHDPGAGRRLTDHGGQHQPFLNALQQNGFAQIVGEKSP